MAVDTVVSSDAQRVRVWDGFVRLFHWIVTVSFFVAYFTEDDLLTLHVWAGYVIGALVIMRILWGFVGPRYARFSDFVCSPMKASRYLLDLLGFRAKRYLGHSPAGGWMVLILLAGLCITVWSGLEVYAVEENAGPLALGENSIPIQTARAEEEHGSSKHRTYDRSGGSRFWREGHELIANLMLFLVILHVAGVLLASFVHRENLVRSMADGWKRPE